MKRLFKLPARPSPGAFESLLRPHLEALYRLAFRFTGNPQDAEDLVQDVLVKLYPRSAELAAIENLRPWLARVLYRRHVDNRRRHARTPFARLQVVDAGAEAETTDPVDILPTGSPTPEQQCEQHVTRKRLQRALDRLGAEQRLVVMLHDVEGYTLNELESILDVPLGTLKSRLHRARRQLRTDLDADMEPFPLSRRVAV